LQLDSVQVVLKPVDPNLIDDTAPPPPQVAIAASGDATPFRLTVVRDETQARASVTAMRPASSRSKVRIIRRQGNRS
jgi:hypothetical protein